MATEPPRDAYADALRAVWARSDFERGRVANPFVDAAAGERGLRRTAALLARLGRPQDRFGALHVAGSKGKGSTAAMLDAVLRAAGWGTGLYTSPHLHTVRERVAIDGVPIAEDRFAGLAERVEAAAAAIEREDRGLGGVTTFEVLTAIGFLAFAEAGCCLVVVEVGLGGSWDATNVLTPLVSVITRLDLEHTAILGRTLPEIAAAKAGIVKPGVPVVVAPQAAEALAVVERAAAEHGAPQLVGDRDWRVAGGWRRFDAVGPWGEYRGLRLGLPGAHQVENAGLALAALWALHPAGIAVPAEAVRDGLATVAWPGRFERVVRPGEATVILDGAHTPASAAALAAALAAEFPGERAVVVLGTSADKEPAALVGALAPVAKAVVATRADHPRAMTAEAVAAGVAAGVAELPVEAAAGVPAALARAAALAGPEGLVLVTGSLFVVAGAREALGLARPDPAL